MRDAVVLSAPLKSLARRVTRGSCRPWIRGYAYTQWGCVLTAQSVTDGHALVVIDRSPGDNCPTSGATTPTDMLLMAAFERSRPVFVNRVSHPTLAGLPEGYPAIHAFALLPCQLSEQIVAVICLVNPQQAFASPVINRLHAGMRLSTSALKTPTADTMLSDALSVYFQPQWNLDTGTLYGLEVLARWHARSDPPSTPSCLKLLQRQGKLAEVGHHIIASVCEHWATWDAANLISDVDWPSTVLVQGNLLCRGWRACP